MTDDAGSAIDPAELALERRRWGELSDLMASLTPSQAMTAGYFEESWSAKDMLAYIGAWLAEAGRCSSRSGPVLSGPTRSTSMP